MAESESAHGLRKALTFFGPLRPYVLDFARRVGHPRYSWLLDRLNWEMHLAGTLRAFPGAVVLPSREQLHDHISEKLLDDGKRAIDFFEFGVAAGASFRRWLDLNDNVDSRFFGFDSFEGLPETWNVRHSAGGFNLGGKPPSIADGRAQFIVGRFQETLADFVSGYQPVGQVVMHFDCDLYSSTLYCLTALDRLMVPGTVLLFDEFYDPLHEYRALINYCAAYTREFEIVALSAGAVQAAVIFR